MAIHKNVLLTGATGNLGSRILATLLKSNEKMSIYLIVRAENHNKAKLRIRNILNFIACDVRDGWSKKIDLVVLRGDIQEKNLGLKESKIKLLRERIDAVFHCAALADFNKPLGEVRAANVLGTRNVLDFIATSPRAELFNYVGTAFIAGKYRGVFSEDDYNVKQEFNNPYEQSKFESEQLVREIKLDNCRINIFRPSIIVGDYVNAKSLTFQMFYTPLRLLSLGIYDKLPIARETVLNLIPVDKAAEAIFLISSQTKEKFGIYHIVSKTNVGVDHLIQLASKYYNFRPPEYVSLEEFNKLGLTPVLINSIRPYLPYLNFFGRFDSEKTWGFLKKMGFEDFSVDDAFLMRLFKHTLRMGFMKKKGL